MVQERDREGGKKNKSNSSTGAIQAEANLQEKSLVIICNFYLQSKRVTFKVKNYKIRNGAIQ